MPGLHKRRWARRLLLFVSGVLLSPVQAQVADSLDDALGAVDAWGRFSEVLQTGGTPANSTDPVDCLGILDPFFCNATAECYYRNVSASDTGPCVDKVPLAPRSGGPVQADAVWCYEHFPFWVLVLLYFFNAFSVGFGVIGLLYTLRHANRRFKVDPKTRVTYRNRMLGYHPAVVVICLLFVACGVGMCWGTMMYLITPTTCSWVPFSYAFVVLVVLVLGYNVAWRGTAALAAKRAQAKQDAKDRQRMADVFRTVSLAHGSNTVRYI